MIDWLWDRNMEENEVKSILSKPDDQRFIEIASLLLERKNIPKEVFGDYLDKKVFVGHWPRLKRQMRLNRWSSGRIVFWQAVYENLKERFQKEGIIFRRASSKMDRDELFFRVGGEIKKLREISHLTQADLARRLGVSQQVISYLESGRGGINLSTLKKVAAVFNKKVEVSMV